MSYLIFVLLMTLSSCAFSQSNNLNESNLSDENLVGEWILDLRPSPDAKPYLQILVISKQEGKNFTGSFYGSPIQNALINENWDKLYFAFNTSDNSSRYYQSGYIIGDKIFGVTYCPERNFVMPWTGEKKVKK